MKLVKDKIIEASENELFQYWLDHKDDLRKAPILSYTDWRNTLKVIITDNNTPIVWGDDETEI